MDTPTHVSALDSNGRVQLATADSQNAHIFAMLAVSLKEARHYRRPYFPLLATGTTCFGFFLGQAIRLFPFPTIKRFGGWRRSEGPVRPCIHIADSEGQCRDDRAASRPLILSGRDSLGTVHRLASGRMLGNQLFCPD